MRPGSATIWMGTRARDAIAGRGPDRRLRARRLQDHRHARHVDRHAGIVVPRAPERIDQARQIGLRAADEGRGIGGRIGLQALKGRRILDGLLQIVVFAADDDIEGVRQGIRAGSGRRVTAAAEPAEEVEREGRRERQPTEQNAHAKETQDPSVGAQPRQLRHDLPVEADRWNMVSKSWHAASASDDQDSPVLLGGVPNHSFRSGKTLASRFLLDLMNGNVEWRGK